VGSTRLRTLSKFTKPLQNIASSVLLKLDHKNAAAKFSLSYFRLGIFQKNPVLDLQFQKNYTVFPILPLYIHKKFIFTLIVVGIFKESLW